MCLQAGLRPVRTSGVRVEREVVQAPAGGAVPLVHNYGHGGSGITLHWGCVQQALEYAHADLRAIAAEAARAGSAGRA